MEVPKLRIFETVKESLAATCFVEGKGRFHTKQKQRAVEALLGFIMHVLYLHTEADTVKEYMDSIYITGVAFATIVGYMCTIFKSELIFICMDEIENVVSLAYGVNLHRFWYSRLLLITKQD